MHLDLGFALRALRRNPTYTVAAIVTLGLGVGTTTAVFSLTQGILLRALPFEHTERLIEAYELSPQGNIRPPSYPTFVDWRVAAGPAFADMAYAYGRAPLMPTDDGPTAVLTAYVSEGFFRTLGATPQTGRLITGAETGADAGAAVVSHSFWMRYLGGDTDAVGRTIVLDDRTFVVAGVLPAEATYPGWAAAWVPLDALPPDGVRALARRDRHADAVAFARLQANGSLAGAQAALARAAQRQAAAYPAIGTGWADVQLQRIRDRILGNAPQRLAVLGLTGALVLVLACVNVMGLALVRVTTRLKELAVRTALGAERGHLVRLIGAEILAVAVAGAALGSGVAVGTTRYLQHAAPALLPRLANVHLGPGTVAFGIGVSLLAALALGIGPAWIGARTSPGLALATTRAGSAHRGAGRVRTTLVALQLAVALALLSGTGLLFRSLVALDAVDPGFDPADLVTVRIQPPAAPYEDMDQLVGLYRRIEERVGALPGVERAALSNHLPVGGSWMPTPIAIEGDRPDADADQALFRTVSPGYFATMRIPLLAGRPFDEGDLTGEPVAIVNRSLAARFGPDGDPLGQSLTVHRSVQGRADFGEPIRVRVVGVAGDVRHFGLDQPLTAEVYLPYTVNPPTWIQLAVRARGEAGRLVPVLREQLRAVEPLLPLGDAFDTIASRLDRGRAPRAFLARVVSVFAALAVLLAAVGVWGITAYAVARRRHEIGVRVALGADGSRLPLTFVRGMVPVVGAALLPGIAAALAVGRIMRSQLFGISATDPVALLGAAVALVGIALLATYLPARKAATVDPAAVLREE
jgi:putative ABC transport system permease protein